MTVLAMMLTGHVLVGIMGTGVLHFYFPALLLLFQAFCQEFLKTSYNESNNLVALLIDKCSAVTLYFTNYSVMVKEAVSGRLVLRLAVVVLVTAALTAVSLLLYRLRGSEAAGKAMAFRKSRALIRIPIVILSSLGGGLFFWYLRNSIGWVLFGIICGMVLSHCVIEIIYHFDFKKLFSNRISMAVCAVAAALFFGVFRYDLLGYDQYIPEQSSVDSMALSLSNMEYWVSYGNAAIDNEGDYYWDYESPNAYLFSHMNLTDTGTALALVSEAVSQIQQEKETGRSAWELADGGRYISFSVLYRLKNGKEVKRSYAVYGSRAYELIKQIYGSAEYRKAAYPLMEQTPEDTAKIKVAEEGWTSEVNRGSGKDADYVERILRAYQEEFLALTPAAMEQENPVATIQFMTANQKAAEEKKQAEGSSWRYDNIQSKGYYPIYPSFDKTIGLLKECGIEVNREIVVSDIKEATIDLWQPVNSDDDSYGEDSAVMYDEMAAAKPENGEELSSVCTVTDKAELEALMEHAVSEGDSGMNPFWNGENRISFEVVVSGKNGQSSHQYSILRSDIPEFLKEKAAEYRKMAG